MLRYSPALLAALLVAACADTPSAPTATLARASGRASAVYDDASTTVSSTGFTVTLLPSGGADGAAVTDIADHGNAVGWGFASGSLKEHVWDEAGVAAIA